MSEDKGKAYLKLEELIDGLMNRNEELHSKVDCAIEALTEIRQSIDEYNQIYDLHTDMALLLEDIDGVAFKALEEIEVEE